MGQKQSEKFNQAKIRFADLPTYGFIKHFKCQWWGVRVYRTDGNCLHCFKNNDVHKSDLKKPQSPEVMDMFKDG